MAERVLFLTPPREDYLAVLLLHGLRMQPGIEVVDWPRYDVAYSDYPAAQRTFVYGRGFTAFFNLESAAVDRTDIEKRFKAGEFRWIVVSNIWHLFETFARWRQWLDPTTTIIVDGADSPQVYPHAGLWWRHLRYWALPEAATGFLYFKREWTEDSQFNIWHRILPRSIRRELPHYDRLRPISFAIPEAKIVSRVPRKTKDFPRHVVDAELAVQIPGSSQSYAFASEADYYADLQASRFGITTRRAGWDCLRHYEIAANGCVPCFRDIGRKPPSCAPHGLVPGINCLGYKNSDELHAMIRSISAERYRSLAEGALQWAWANTTRQCAQQLLGCMETKQA